MDPFAHLDLLSVGIAVAGTGLLGILILLNDAKSATNRAFFYFTVVTVGWSVVNYAYYQVHASLLALTLLRLVIFFATWHAFTFFHLTLTFPSTESVKAWWFRFVITPLTIGVSVLTLTPLIFQRILSADAQGKIQTIQNGPAIPVFGITVACLIVAGIFLFSRKTFHAPKAERRPYSLILLGMVMTFTLLITFNLVLPAAFNQARFIPLGAVFLLPFVIFSAFAIARYRLFHIRVAAIALMSFLLCVAIFLEIIFSPSLAQLLFTVGQFILILVFSIWLIQGVVREAKQREQIQLLAEELERANARQVTLIHFISHQLKGFIGKARGIFSMLQEGDYGELPETMKSVVEEGFNSASHGAETIQDILNASNMKSGQMAYAMVPFDFKELVESIVRTLKPNADAKGVALTLTEPEGSVMFTGDRMQLENALKNLIDNCIKYTPQGSIKATLTFDGKLIRFWTEDTGVGITSEDMKRLFTEGGHGAESQMVNVNSTGFGLYIVKNIIEAHGGKVWAESDGAGKGAKFIVELPVSQSAPSA